MTIAELKAIEDMIDALVCAWVGIKYLAGETDPYGDDTAAIWVPRLSLLAQLPGNDGGYPPLNRRVQSAEQE